MKIIGSNRNATLYTIVYTGSKCEDNHCLISNDIFVSKPLTRKVMRKRNILDVGQTYYEKFNLSAYTQGFIDLFAISIDYIYIYIYIYIDF